MPYLEGRDCRLAPLTLNVLSDLASYHFAHSFTHPPT